MARDLFGIRTRQVCPNRLKTRLFAVASKPLFQSTHGTVADIECANSLRWRDLGWSK